MGDPKKQRKKYETPGHPWQRARIDDERVLVEEYGFKNKREIWKMSAFLKNATAQAKKLVTRSGFQADTEKELLITKLKRYGLLKQDAGLDAILSISLRDVLERRLQTQVYKKGLANSVKQARQFITHEHVCIGNKVVTSPSYLVPLSEEGQISFSHTSGLSDPEHPERVAAKKTKEQGPKEKVVKEKDDRKGGYSKGFNKKEGFKPKRQFKRPESGDGKKGVADTKGGKK
jgi:small subunit ribosomal protein S4